MNVIAASTWAYPAIETLHIMGVAMLVGSLVVFELRIWGVGRGLEIGALARLALPVTVVGFALVASSGGLLFWASFDEMLGNRVFLVKMGLVVLAGLNAIWFHARDGLRADDRLGRAQTALSLGLWLVVIACGRFIAYN